MSCQQGKNVLQTMQIHLPVRNEAGSHRIMVQILGSPNNIMMHGTQDHCLGKDTRLSIAGFDKYASKNSTLGLRVWALCALATTKNMYQVHHASHPSDAPPGFHVGFVQGYGSSSFWDCVAYCKASHRQDAACYSLYRPASYSLYRLACHRNHCETTLPSTKSPSGAFWVVTT